MTEGERATTASIDRRVERLEQAQAEMAQQIALVQLEQSHLKELVNSRFSSLESAIGMLGAKLDSITTLIQAASADAMATPAGRNALATLTQLQAQVDTHDQLINQAQGSIRAWKWLAGFVSLPGISALLFWASQYMNNLR